MRLSAIDDEQFLRDIIDDANRSNTTFYPIDPRGLVALETGGGSRCLADRRRSRLRTDPCDSMRTLADGTDGIAVMDTQRSRQGPPQDLRRPHLLLSSRLLLDERENRWRVSIAEGAGEAARRGRPCPSRLSCRQRGGSGEARGRRPPLPPWTPRRRSTAAHRTCSASGPAGRAGSPARDPVAGRRSSVDRRRAVAAPGRADEWGRGATADLQVSVGGGAGGRAGCTIKPGDRTFLTSVDAAGRQDADLDVQARVTPADGGAAPPPSPSASPWRRSRSSTGVVRRQPIGRCQPPICDSRAPIAPISSCPSRPDVKPGRAGLLDRTGQALGVPVTMGERTDDAGQRWITAESCSRRSRRRLPVEIATTEKGAESRVVAAIRVVR